MSRKLFRWAATIQLCLAIFTGCQPTQPFFVRRDDAMANYMAQSMAIEYADVHVESLPEATQAMAPLGPNHIPTKFTDLTLEDCIAMALDNTKIFRVVNGANSQSGDSAAAIVSAAPGQLPSIYDPALAATTGNTQPLAVDSQGNRIAPRGSARANQVGGVEDALSEFDTQFSSLFGYNTTDRPRNVGPGNVFNPQFFRAVDANAQAALSKRMATGTILTARTTTVYSRNNLIDRTITPTGPTVARSVPSDYTVALEMQATQPLMRGRGALVNRIPVVLARINEDLQLHDFRAQVRNLLRDVEAAYWDLYCGYRAFETATDARDSALALWRVADARVNVSGPEAEAQARALVKQFESQVHASLYGSTVAGNDPRGLYGREQTLREKIGWSPTDDSLIRPSDNPSVARVHFDWNEVHSEALQRSVELRKQNWAIQSAQLEMVSAKNQLLPQLDVTAFYRWLGVGDQLASAKRDTARFPEAHSNALQELTSGDYQELGMRLEYTPQAIGKRRALTNIRNRQIQIAKLQEEMREKEVMVVNRLSEAWRGMESSYVYIQDYRDTLQANVDEIKIYNDKISKGTNELGQLADIVLRAEERRARTQLQYYQAICEYNKWIMLVHYWKGSLLDLNAVDLAEGEWVDKAYWDAEERSRERAGGMYFDYGYTRPAVVSAGPEVYGAQTEGNISDPGAGVSNRSNNQPTPAEELEEDDDEVQQTEEPPTASRLRLRNQVSLNNAAGSYGDGVVRAAATDSFEWGGLGDQATASRSVQPAIATSSGRSQAISSPPASTRSQWAPR